MNNNLPSISVVIPSGKDDLRLRWCLEGLARQSFRAFETIVVNDGGAAPGATANVLREVYGRLSYKWGARIEYALPASDMFRAGLARNLGAVYARAPLIVFLDADCVPDPTHLEEYADAFSSSVKAGKKHIYYGQRRNVPENKVVPFSRMNYGELFAQAEPNPKHEIFHTFSCAVPTDGFLESGGFDLRFNGFGCEDVDLSLRLQRMGYELFDMKGWVTHLDHKRTYGKILDNKVLQDVLNSDTSIIRNGGPLVSRVK